MLKKLQENKNKNEGFTIIEVMIVLAIAGLILLIVFLAIPALQRNSRNTQRKNDVSALLGAVNEFTSNTNGTLPTTAADQTTTLANARTGYYQGAGTGQGQIAWAAGLQAAPAAMPANDRVIIVTGARCGAAGATVVGSARQVAVQYQTEGSGNPIPTCQDS